jgi:hypothetical protein
MYGGAGALENALYDSRANAIVIIGDRGQASRFVQGPRLPLFAAYLDSRVSLDVSRVRITVEVAGE